MESVVSRVIGVDVPLMKRLMIGSKVRRTNFAWFAKPLPMFASHMRDIDPLCWTPVLGIRHNDGILEFGYDECVLFFTNKSSSSRMFGVESKTASPKCTSLCQKEFATVDEIKKCGGDVVEKANNGFIAFRLPEIHDKCEDDEMSRRSLNSSLMTAETQPSQLDDGMEEKFVHDYDGDYVYSRSLNSSILTNSRTEHSDLSVGDGHESLRDDGQYEAFRLHEDHKDDNDDRQRSLNSLLFEVEDDDSESALHRNKEQKLQLREKMGRAARRFRNTLSRFKRRFLRICCCSAGISNLDNVS